jgi:hypothetical protein
MFVNAVPQALDYGKSALPQRTKIMRLDVRFAGLNSGEQALEEITESAFRPFREAVDDPQLIHRKQPEFGMSNVDLVPQGHGRNEIALDVSVREANVPEAATGSVARVAIASRREEYLKGLGKVQDDLGDEFAGSAALASEPAGNMEIVEPGYNPTAPRV